MRLHEYLARVNRSAFERLPPTIDLLRDLHAAHRETFLFENLTIQGGGAVSVALDDIERKFLDEGRGGYCFEHNTLFAAALRAIGFSPIVLIGRVRRGPPGRWARTHMVLAVSIAGREPSAGRRARTWLCDVGFGGISLIEPLPLEEGAVAVQRGLTYRLRREGHLWVLTMRDAVQEMDLYEFSEDPQTEGDVVVANHYTATHPDSAFRRALTIQSVSGDVRTILRSDVLTRYTGGDVVDEPIDRLRLPELARDLFGVELPEGPLVFDSYRVPA